MSTYNQEFNSIKSVLNRYVLSYRAYSQELAQAQRDYTPDAFNRFSNERAAQFKVLKDDYTRQITATCDGLIESIKKRWEPNPTLYRKDVTEMLESPYFNFSLDDLNRMATERFSDNPTMLQVLHNYAKDKGFFKNVDGVTSPLFHADKAEKLETAESLKKSILSAVQSTNQSTVQTMSDKFDDIFKSGMEAIG